MFKSNSITGIMSQFQQTVDRLDALALSKDAESTYLANKAVKVEVLGDRFQLWVYNQSRKLLTAIDELQLKLADKFDGKSQEADAEYQAAVMLADKLRDQFNLK